MNFGEDTNRLIAFRSSPHGQQVRAHIFSVPQQFGFFGIILLL
jgi:hypothetical protein